MFEHSKKYFSYILNPLELLRTKKVLQVNPTIAAQRIEPAEVKIFVYDYNPEKISTAEYKKTDECLGFLDSPGISWINVDGLRKSDVETICAHYGIHYLITEDILSIGQRPKMDEIEGLVFCLLNMLYFNEKDSAVEIEQISIVLGKNFVISFQEDASKDVFNPLREN
jgi:magnesium transporter